MAVVADANPAGGRMVVQALVPIAATTWRFHLLSQVQYDSTALLGYQREYADMLSLGPFIRLEVSPLSRLRPRACCALRPL